eukprot:GILI01034418.1.p1 GENE.GILI01034418.1~~GILI01034418.1.p1  ORF type:complete len:116 (-),score=14.13 GILI01034418.1:91-438(-)
MSAPFGSRRPSIVSSANCGDSVNHETGQLAVVSAPTEFQLALPPGAHVPEFAIESVIPTPAGAPWRARVAFLTRLSVLVIVFAFSITIGKTMRQTAESIEGSAARLATCGSSSLL